MLCMRDRSETLRTIHESALRALYRVLKGHKAATPVYHPESGDEIILDTRTLEYVKKI